MANSRKRAAIMRGPIASPGVKVSNAVGKLRRIRGEVAILLQQIDDALESFDQSGSTP
jgi:hypothetical protein